MKKISTKNSVTIYKNHRSEPYYTYVKNGLKTIEGRINKGDYRLIKPGDIINVFNDDETDSFEVIVKNIRKYKSIK